MKTFQWYLLRRFTAVAGLTVSAVLLLSLLVRAFDEIGDLGAVSPPATVFARYLFLLVPEYLPYALPVGVLVGTLVTLGLAGRYGELVAIQALGGSLRRATAVLLVAGVFVGGFAYVSAERIEPQAARAARLLRETRILGKKPALAVAGRSFWTRTPAGALVRFVAATGERIFDVSIFEFSDKGLLTRRLEAEEGYWNGNGWRLKNVSVHELAPKGLRIIPDMPYEGIERPDRIDAERTRPEQMTRPGLARYIRRLRRAGFDTTRLRVALATRFSHPFMSIAMAALAVGLALRYRAAGGTRASGLAVIVAVLYWASHTMALSLGFSGRLSPMVSAWISPLLFAGAGVFLWVRAER